MKANLSPRIFKNRPIWSHVDDLSLRGGFVMEKEYELFRVKLAARSTFSKNIPKQNVLHKIRKVFAFSETCDSVYFKFGRNIKIQVFANCKPSTFCQVHLLHDVFFPIGSCFFIKWLVLCVSCWCTKLAILSKQPVPTSRLVYFYKCLWWSLFLTKCILAGITHLPKLYLIRRKYAADSYQLSRLSNRGLIQTSLLREVSPAILNQTAL